MAKANMTGALAHTQGNRRLCLSATSRSTTRAIRCQNRRICPSTSRMFLVLAKVGQSLVLPLRVTTRSEPNVAHARNAGDLSEVQRSPILTLADIEAMNARCAAYLDHRVAEERERAPDQYSGCRSPRIGSP